MNTKKRESREELAGVVLFRTFGKTGQPTAVFNFQTVGKTMAAVDFNNVQAFETIIIGQRKTRSLSFLVPLLKTDLKF